MNFATIAYLVFLGLVAAIWNSHRRMSPWFLCCCSLFFYAYWFPPYVLILLACGGLSYGVARILAPPHNRRRTVLLVGIALLLTPLFLFKYVDFFAGMLDAAWADRPAAKGTDPLLAVLPLGISFYTFQAVSYVLDVYNGSLTANRRVRDYLTYLCFFPQLVAGPIVRAAHFLPQLSRRRPLARKDLLAAVHHLSRGFFLKIGVADNLAAAVEVAFDRSATDLGAANAWLGIVLFSIQIFCDFAGYSQIAQGSARLLGFKLQKNFNQPYLAVGVRDFWRRWHISLSTWFRDYVYHPLGGSRVPPVRWAVNILVVFLLSGLWHGAGLQYLLWGGIHGGWLVTERLAGRVSPLRSVLTSVYVKPVSMLATFALVTLSWVPFRAADTVQAVQYWAAMFSGRAGPLTVLSEAALAGLVLFVLYQLWSVPFIRRRIPAYIRVWDRMFFLMVTAVMPGEGVDFIYFQF